MDYQKKNLYLAKKVTQPNKYNTINIEYNFTNFLFEHSLFLIASYFV